MNVVDNIHPGRAAVLTVVVDDNDDLTVDDGAAQRCRDECCRPGCRFQEYGKDGMEMQDVGWSC